MVDEGKERWQELCKQAAKEQDPVKLMKIVQEINDLLDAKLVPHMSHKVELTGDVTENNGASTIAATNLKMISR